MRNWRSNWKKILSVICVIALMAEVIVTSPSLFARAADEDTLKNAIAAENYTATYAQAETADKASETALAQVQAVLSANYSGTSTVVMKGTPTLVRETTGGTFTFSVTVTAEDNTTFDVDNLIMAIAARPQLVKVVFDDEEAVANAGFSTWNVAYTKAFQDDTLSGGKQYMHLEVTPSENQSQLIYYSFLSQSQGKYAMDMDAYPYMKISYRRDVKTTDSEGRLDIQAFNETSDDNADFVCGMNYYKLGTSEEAYWEQMIVDMRSLTADCFSDGTKTGERSMTKVSGSWTGTTQNKSNWEPFRLYFTRHNTKNVKTTFDVEYIAFFASKEEAEAYPVDISSTVGQDQQTLSKAEFSCKAAEASNNEKAYTILNEQISKLGLQTKYTIEEINYVAPTAERDGSYEARVVFDEEHISTVTLIISKLTDALLWSFNSNSIASRLAKNAWNANFVYEDGLVKMTTKDTTNEDGFVIDMDLTSDEIFDASELPYLKIKYKISGAEGAKLQFYNWINDSAYYRQFYGNVSGSDSDWVTLILDLTITEKNKEAVFVQNLSDGTNSTLSYFDTNCTSQEGNITKIRLNLARQANLNRTAELEYMGFFPTYEAAVAYEGMAKAELEAAETYLRENTIQIGWGDGNTEAKALEKVVEATEKCGVGVAISNAVYTAPTGEAQGNVIFDVTLQSAAETKTLTGLIAYIAKKPSEPIIWRFNEAEALKGLTFASATGKIEDYLLKMSSTDPVSDDGFYFLADTAKMGEQFYLQDYPYIQFKYKRNIAAPAQIYFYSDALSGNPVLGSNMGYGPKNETWYTTIVDTAAKNIGETSTYNYNHSTGEYENKVRNRSNGIITDNFVGLSTRFRFNFGRRKYLDRTAEIEYIAFFPTLEDTKAYIENGTQETDRLTSNAQVALKSYAGSVVTYYDGSEEAYAEETAAEIISSLVGDDVTVRVNKSSYTSPVLNISDGAYVFTADICTLDGTILFTTGAYTLSISKTADTNPVIFTFSNPDFITNRVEGANPQAVDYSKMSLSADEGTSNAYFSLNLTSAEKFHLAGLPYIALQASAENMKLLLNDSYYSLGTVTYGTKMVIDAKTGDVYIDGTIDTSQKLSSVQIERITRLGMTSETQSAEVAYIAFFATLEEAKAYNGESEILNQTVNRLKAATLECAYADAKTEEAARKYADCEIKSIAGNDAKVISTTVVSYTAATKAKKGSMKVTAFISVGGESDSHYANVELTITIGKQPSGPIVWSFDKESFTGLSKGWNTTLSIGNGVLTIDSTDASKEDGFGFDIDCTTIGSKFYLQDYPYIKIKMRGTTASTVSGRDLMYINTDESTGAYKQFALFSTAKGVSGSALLDMSEDTVTVCDLDHNQQLSNKPISGNLNYHGIPTKFSFKFGRDIKEAKHAEIEYVAFFPSREEAESYNWDYYYSGYTFNGVEYATAKNELTTAPGTIESGIRIPEGTSSAMTIVSNEQFALKTTSDGNVSFVYNGTEVFKSTGISVYDGAWHHVAVTLEENNAALYVDGESAAISNTFTVGDANAVSKPVIARDSENISPLKGTIYYVRLFKKAKMQEELKTNAFCKSCDDTDVLAGWFMDELSTDKQFTDVYGNNPLTLTDNYGKDGHEFMGSDYIKTEKKLSADPKTFEFWMKTAEENAVGTYTILSNKSDTNTSYTAIELVNNQLKMVYDGKELFTTEDMNLADGIWKHIAVTFNSSESKLYVDGELVKTYAGGDTSASAREVYYIGAGLETTKTPYEGSLSDIRIWNTERTSDEIANNMLEYPKRNTEELLASWRLDTQKYLKYTDYSSNANTGTLYSSGWYKLENISGDYTMVQVADTQSYMLTEPTKLIDMYEGLAKSIDRFKLVHLLHAGDVTQNDTPIEWNYAQQAFAKIENQLQYTIVLGNHDYPSPSSGYGSEYRDSTQFNRAFPYDTIKAQANVKQQYATATFGGAYEEGNSENIYNLLTVGDVKYIIFGLEFGPRDEVLEWTSRVLNQYSDYQAIILTHCYFETWGDLTVYNAKSYGDDFQQGANDGVDIWNKLLSRHNNIALISCGHSQNMQLLYKVSETEYGNDVVQLIADPSAMPKFPSEEGLVMLMSFTEDGKTMHTYYYSPLYDAFYDTANEITFEMNGKDKSDLVKVVEYEDIAVYRTQNNYTAPDAPVAGYVFSGWYKDQDCTKALATDATSGAAYAKFVKAEVLTAKAQIGVEKDGSVPENQTSLRFVTTVDSLQYQQVAFMISKRNANGTYTDAKNTADFDENSKTVYKTLYAIGSDSQVIEYDPSVFSSTSKYFKAWTLSGIPASEYSTKIKVTPYWITLDGTKVLGTTTVKTIENYINSLK